MPPRKTTRKTKSYYQPVLVDSSEERHILDFRPLGFHDIAVLGRYQYAKAHSALQLHSHGRMIEICYLESGQQIYYVNKEKYRLNGGDIFVTFPHECHGSGTIPQNKGVLYWLLINIPYSKGRLLSLTKPETQIMLERLLNLPIRQFSGSDDIRRILRELFGAFYREDDPLRLIKLRNLLLGFLIKVLEASQNAHRRISPEVQAVQQTIAENLDQTLPIRRLAQIAHLSESRFKARFKAEIGMPPADYAMRQRIGRAKLLLQQRNLSVTEIAMHLGFSSSQYFATVFKRSTNQTPSSYRQQQEIY